VNQQALAAGMYSSLKAQQEAAAARKTEALKPTFSQTGYYADTHSIQRSPNIPDETPVPFYEGSRMVGYEDSFTKQSILLHPNQVVYPEQLQRAGQEYAAFHILENQEKQKGTETVSQSPFIESPQKKQEGGLKTFFSDLMHLGKVQQQFDTGMMQAKLNIEEQAAKNKNPWVNAGLTIEYVGLGVFSGASSIYVHPVKTAEGMANMLVGSFFWPEKYDETVQQTWQEIKTNPLWAGTNFLGGFVGFKWLGEGVRAEWKVIAGRKEPFIMGVNQEIVDVEITNTAANAGIKSNLHIGIGNKKYLVKGEGASYNIITETGTTDFGAFRFDVTPFRYSQNKVSVVPMNEGELPFFKTIVNPEAQATVQTIPSKMQQISQKSFGSTKKTEGGYTGGAIFKNTNLLDKQSNSGLAVFSGEKIGEVSGMPTYKLMMYSEKIASVDTLKTITETGHKLTFENTEFQFEDSIIAGTLYNNQNPGSAAYKFVEGQAHNMAKTLKEQGATGKPIFRETKTNVVNVEPQQIRYGYATEIAEIKMNDVTNQLWVSSQKVGGGIDFISSIDFSLKQPKGAAPSNAPGKVQSVHMPQEEVQAPSTAVLSTTRSGQLQGVKEIFVQEQAASALQVSKGITALGTSTLFVQKEMQVQEPKPLEVQAQEPIQKPAAIQATNTEQVQKAFQVPKEVQVQKPLQASVQKAISIQGFEQVQKSIQEPVIIINPNQIVSAKPFDFVSLDDTNKKGGFEVFVRREGKFKKIGESQNMLSAFQIGVSKVESTAAASFKVIFKGSNEPVINGLVPAQKFTASKKESGVFIQKRSFRISSPGEKTEIPGKAKLLSVFKKGKMGVF
jgi:hypothetical protein